MKQPILVSSWIIRICIIQMILLSPKPNFLALLSWTNAACIPGRSTNCWPVEGFQPAGCSQRVASFSEQTAWHQFWGAWQSLVSFTDFLVQTWWCWTTTDSLFGWTWTSQTYWGCSIRLTSLHLKFPSDYDFTSSKLYTWSFPQQLDTTYIPSCNLIQFGDIHNKPPSKTNSCRVG